MQPRFEDFLQRYTKLPEEAKHAAVDAAIKATSAGPWVPNPGPQLEAYLSEADELYYGGQAGGGKSDLLIGLSLTSHFDSLILRRVNDDAKEMAERAREIAGDGTSFNSIHKILKLGEHTTRFAGCQHEHDKERFKGRPKDLFGFDEIGDFTKGMYKFITAWNRSTRPGQRCRVVATGNPPTRPEGLWVLQYWGAWLDKKHPNPALPGELRWYTTDDLGNEIEVDGRGPHDLENCAKPVFARSRTFIRAELRDNPDLAATDYQASLDSLPAELRSAYRDGNFQAQLKDDDYQLIPTSWLLAAMERWTPDGHKALAMTALACDPAGGGADSAVICWRHGGWYAPFIEIKGKDTADGSAMAGRIIQHRRDACPVVVDVGGGYGGSYLQRLKDNQVNAVQFNGAQSSAATTQDSAQLRFRNKRAEAYWRFREALNPDQEGGSVIALPPDDELKADLAAVHWELTNAGVLIEPKDDIKERIGRSPNKGDACVMCMSEGQAALRRALFGGSGRNGQPVVKIGHAKAKAKYRR
jgi:hypothetical protein